MNTQHKAARATRIPSRVTLCINTAHPYQNTGFARQKRQFLSPLFSHACAHLRLQPLCFDTLHKNTRGEGGYSGGNSSGEWLVASQRNPRTDLKVGHYIRKREAGGMTGGRQAERGEKGARFRKRPLQRREAPPRSGCVQLPSLLS